MIPARIKESVQYGNVKFSVMTQDRLLIVGTIRTTEETIVRKETEAILFYICSTGHQSVSKSLVEKIEKIFADNENMCLKKKLDSKNKSYNLAIVTAKLPDEVYQKIIGYFNQRMGKNLKWDSKETKRLIEARFAEGYGVEDFKKVIDNKIFSWQSDKKMCTYLRPSTLFGNKFDEYLNETRIGSCGIIGQPSFNINQIQNDAMQNTTIRGL